MIEQRIKSIEEQITLGGLLPGVDLSCLPLEESARLKRVVLDLFRLIHASGFNAGADYAMNANFGDIESIPGMRFSIDETHASTLAQIAPAVEPFSVSGSRAKLASKQSLSVSRDSKPANPSKRGHNAPTEGNPKKARQRSQKRRARPTSISGYHWRNEGASGEIRNEISVEENGARKRKPP